MDEHSQRLASSMPAASSWPAARASTSRARPARCSCSAAGLEGSSAIAAPATSRPGAGRPRCRAQIRRRSAPAVPSPGARGHRSGRACPVVSAGCDRRRLAGDRSLQKWFSINCDRAGGACRARAWQRHPQHCARRNRCRRCRQLYKAMDMGAPPADGGRRAACRATSLACSCRPALRAPLRAGVPTTPAAPAASGWRVRIHRCRGAAPPR